MAENFDHIDQIIRQKFENFEPEPPVSAWEKIRSQINQDPPKGSTGFILPMIITLSLLLFIGGLIHHFNDTPIPSVSENQWQAATFSTATELSTGSTTMAGNAALAASYPESDQNRLEDIANQVAHTASTIPVREPLPIPFTSGKKKAPRPVNPTALGKYMAEKRTGQWKPGLRQALTSGELSYTDAVHYNLSLRDIRKLTRYGEYYKKTKADWSIGVYFMPEVTNYRDKSLDNTVNYSLSVLPQLNWRRFFLQSGVSIRQTYDKGNYAIEYNRYLGSYEDVYLVTFDSTENGVIPTYHTETVNVYDSIDHFALSETRANYAYLDIPVMAGYRVPLGKFSLQVKAGPSAAFMLASHLPEPADPEDKARIINADYQVPARTLVNWQFNLAAGIEYSLNDNLFFGMEPTFRFAMKPEYQLPDATGNDWKSYSFGLRAGLRYNF